MTGFTLQVDLDQVSQTRPIFQQASYTSTRLPISGQVNSLCPDKTS